MKKMITIFLCGMFLINCGKKVDDADTQPNARVGELRGKYQENLQRAAQTWDQETGWPDTQDCDATLWAGLARGAGAVGVQLELAKHADGKIHRRPSTPCYADGQDLGAKSTISKDNLTGYVLGVWRTSSREALEYLFSYGKEHDWIMGEPASAVGDVVYTPNAIATLCNAIKTLGGKDPLECSLPTSFSHGSADFEKHLAVLGILLWGEVHPGHALVDQIPQDALATLTDLANHNVQDALFNAAYAQYSNGDYSMATDLLLDPNYVYPTYVRGSENYKLVHWLFSANLILRHF